MIFADFVGQGINRYYLVSAAVSCTYRKLAK